MDEEILKRMAEIEELTLTGRMMGGHLEYVHSEGGLDYFNPLTNWSDLMPMVEERVKQGWIFTLSKDVKDLQRWFCLSIIEGEDRG